MFGIQRKQAVGITLLMLVVTGCQNTDPVQPPPLPVFTGTVTLVQEPAFTAGTTNTVAWSVDVEAIPADWTFSAQSASDPAFTADVVTGPWLNGDNYTFDNLQDGATVYYRVKARDGQLTESDWSTPTSSVQDALPPVATVMPLAADQTSLLFAVEIAASDGGSGLAQIELWYRKNNGELLLHGVVDPGVTNFQTDAGGPHEFFAVATDIAGNAQEMPALAQASTVVPEPIILIDRDNYAWDITNAVLKHHIAEPWWAFGLGRFTIRPVINPTMIGPGDFGYPTSTNIADVVAVNFEGDIRAYKINDLPDREVVDDVVNGVPVAVSY